VRDSGLNLYLSCKVIYNLTVLKMTKSSMFVFYLGVTCMFMGTCTYRHISICRQA